jgi:hypothetical protein
MRGEVSKQTMRKGWHIPANLYVITVVKSMFLSAGWPHSY